MKLGRLSVVALVVSFAALLLLMGTVSTEHAGRFGRDGCHHADPG